MAKKIKVKITELTKRQSDEILDFFFEQGVNTFKFALLNMSENSVVIRVEEELMTILKSFRTEDKFMHVYNKAIVDFLKNYVIEGVLPNYFQKQFSFEDFVFFRNNTAFFETTTHEQIGILYLDQSELEKFKALNIDFKIEEI